MLMNNSDNEKLLSKLVPVSVTDEYSNQPRECHLYFTMERQNQLPGVKVPKVLSFTLTDNDDPFFLYNLKLSVDDYQELKKTLGIRVEFPDFPEEVKRLIDLCLHKRNTETEYLMVFNISKKQFPNTAHLDIMQVSHFRAGAELTLKFVAASETMLKHYLTSSFRSLKEENRELQNTIAFLERDFKSKSLASQAMSSGKLQELEEEIKQLRFELNEKDNKYRAELQEERERFISRHKDELNRLEKEIKEKDYKNDKEIQQFESRLRILENLNKELNDKNLTNESTNRELRSKIFSLEDEKKHLQENLLLYEHKLEQLQSEVKEKKSSLHQLEEKIKNLNQNLRRIEHSNSKLKEQILKETELKKSIQNELDDVKFRLDMAEKTKQVLENDIGRLNNIIVGLQEKSKGLSDEQKSKSHLVSKYKKIIEEKDKALLDIKQKIVELNIELQAKDAEMRHLTESKCALESKIKEVTDECIHKDRVVRWLNKQLTENRITAQYTTPTHLTSPSALAQEHLAKIGSENSPPLNSKKNAPVRMNAPSPVCKQNTATPSQLHKTAGTDSAYKTASLHSNQATPEILAGNHNVNFDPSNFNNEEEALSAAFRNGGLSLKHSTAKKPTRPVKSTTPKSSKKR